VKGDEAAGTDKYDVSAGDDGNVPFNTGKWEEITSLCSPEGI
jgi:hypothetical protein